MILALLAQRSLDTFCRVAMTHRGGRTSSGMGADRVADALANLLRDFEGCSGLLTPEQLPYLPDVVSAGREGRMSTWVVLVCVGGISLTSFSGCYSRAGITDDA